MYPNHSDYRLTQGSPKPFSTSVEIFDKPEVSVHGAFGSCTCNRCMNDAKTEVEKHFTDEKWTSNYISKLQAQVERLELDNAALARSGRRYNSSIIYHDSGDERLPIIDVLPDDGPVVEVLERDKADRAIEEPKVEIKRRRKVQQHFGEAKIERDDNPNFGPQGYGGETVLTVTREFDTNKHFWRRLVDIVSPAFVQLLHEESPYDIDLHLVDGILALHDPLMTLFHNRKIMNRYIEKGGYASDSDNVKQARAHTKLILDFMRKELDQSRVLDDLESEQPSGLIEFSNIWLLYPPGTVVYTKEGGEYEAYVVDSVEGVRKSLRYRSGSHTYSRIELTCWSVNYDGEVFGRVWSTHEIFPFMGTKEIASLDLVPEKFLTDVANIQSTLRARGEQFFGLQGQNYREYTGEVWSQNASEETSRVMVDHLTYQRRRNWPISINGKKGPATAVSKNWRDNKFSYERNPPLPRAYNDWDYDPRSMPAPRKVRRHARDEIGRDYSPDRDCDEDASFEGQYLRFNCDRPPLRADSKFKQYDIVEADSRPDGLLLLLCPQQVHGYSFRDKVWKSFNVTQLKLVNFRKNAWNRLVLDEEYKDIVQAMVASYVDKTADLGDLVAGKGAGLVALLHGPPGTGKTLTAECVAESFGKPLYQVTCGDIGTQAGQLEHRLEEIFDYATTWGAILLLDEADVFLQERDYVHLERNALVSSKS